LTVIKDYRLVVIDEAQKVNEIGQSLKIMVDQIDGLQIIATGSSSFDLANQIGEPLVGRKTTIKLFPISCLELKRNQGAFEVHQQLENLLLNFFPSFLYYSKTAEG
jgi:hypothetical protein